MKTEKEIKEKIRELKKLRDVSNFRGATYYRCCAGVQYLISNCRWVDMKTQQRNRSNNHLVTINGETKCVAEWCLIYPISPSAVWKRTDKGMDIVTAITKPSRKWRYWE